MNQRAPDTKDTRPEPDWSRIGAQVLALVAVVTLLVVGWNLGQSDPVPQRGDQPDIQAADLPEGETPEPYYYDEPNNRWWHVENGEGHWHQGPPPPEDQRE